MKGTPVFRKTGLARVAAIALLLGLAAANLLAEHVVAVGDVHGAYEQFVAILQAAGVIDKDLNWTGGKTILVQTGDVLDRGPRSKDALDLLMNLSEKAGKQGGEVRPLLGNHETMVMMGDLRYVSAEEYASYATPDTEKLRESEYENYLKYRKQRASRQRQPGPSASDSEKQSWMKAHPPGFFELRQAFAPKGKYGTWLRGRDAVTQVGDTVFLHGGLSPQLPLKSVKDIDEKIRKEIVQLDEVWNKLAKRGIIWQYQTLEEAQTEARAEWQTLQATGGNDTELMTFLNLKALLMISPEGPLWYRGYAEDSDSNYAQKLDQLLKRFKIHHVVVGHTVAASKRITPRYDGRVFLIDTGMLEFYFHGKPSALDINDGQFRAIYVGESPQPLLGGGEVKTQ